MQKGQYKGLRVGTTSGLEKGQRRGLYRGTTNNETKISNIGTQDPRELFGKNLKLWIDTSSTTRKTLSGNFNTELTTLTSDDDNHYQFDKESNTMKYCNDKWFVFTRNTESLLHSSTSTFNMLHDGTDFVIGFRIMILRGLDEFYPIIVNNGGSTAQTGILISYDNRAGSSRTHALNITITKSSAGNSVYAGTLQNFFVEGVWTTVILAKIGTQLFVYKGLASTARLTLVTTLSRLNTPVVTDATANFNVFKNSGGATYMRYALFKHLTIAQGATNFSQWTKMHEYFCQGDAFGTGEKAYVYWLHGQSNAEGAASNPPAYLQPEINAYIWGHTLTSGDDTTNFLKLQWPTSTATGVGDVYGPELEFGYRMSLVKPGQVFIMKTAKSSTPLYVAAGGVDDWNIASSGEMADAANGAITRGLNILVYELNRNVKICGWLWRQGEADAQTGIDKANYKTNLYATFKKWIDRIYDTPANANILGPSGINSARIRGVISLVDNTFSPLRTHQADIVAAQQAFTTDFFTDNPTYVTKAKGFSYFSTAAYVTSDGTHFDDTWSVQQGLDWYTAQIPFIDE